MSGGPSAGSVADAAKAVGDLLGQSAKLSLSLLDSVKLPMPRKSCACYCEIPPPCWEPQPIGDVTTCASPGNKAVLRLHVRNCGPSGRTVSVDATDAAVVVDPTSLTLGPMEDGTVVLSLEIPANTADGAHEKSVVWIRGCYLHYLRWTVDVTCRCANSCSDVDVEDCLDLVHHWYDHFYCVRPCPHQR